MKRIRALIECTVHALVRVKTHFPDEARGWPACPQGACALNDCLRAFKSTGFRLFRCVRTSTSSATRATRKKKGIRKNSAMRGEILIIKGTNLYLSSYARSKEQAISSCSVSRNQGKKARCKQRALLLRMVEISRRDSARYHNTPDASLYSKYCTC